ncbi:MAG: rhodanese-like domain-containing protein [Deferribacteres bacterium]|nr:rhodanese-like domain-containing protein [candidate division KSB1 bacterium]MCB9511615.1 rhodanese-like domain-containing protein [Deferribacteres bacterium]
MKTKNIQTAVRVLLSAIFVLSAFGKAIDIPAAALPISQLFYLPANLARIFIVALVIFELAVVLLLWKRPTLLLLIAPAAFAFVLVYSALKGVDCGCFGALPFLKEFPLGGHVLLVLGIFTGIWFLAKSGQLEPQSASRLGMVTIIALVLAFASVPFASSPATVIADEAGAGTVDMAGVQQAIAEGSAVIIDARDENQFLFGHIDGAINIYVDDDDIAAQVDAHKLRERALIVYCSSAHCDMAERLTEKLRTLGCQNVKIYPGGWEEWVLEGY